MARPFYSEAEVNAFRDKSAKANPPTPPGRTSRMARPSRGTSHLK